VIHRLSIAGETGQVVFDDGALDLVQRCSGGVPRVINLLCDRALMIGAQSDERVINAQTIANAITGLGLPVPPASTGWWRRLRRRLSFNRR
jgi:general secretion pathway protein A